MGIWQLLGRLVRVSPTENWLVTDESAGRLIYEYYDPLIGKSSEGSKYFLVNLGKVISRNPSDDPEVLGTLQIDLQNADMAKELQED